MTKSKVDELNGDEGSSTGNEDSSSSHGEFSAMKGLRENARVAMSALCDAGRGASAAATELGEEAYKASAKTGARIARKVEAQPMASVMVAASLGLVAGVLLSRR